MGQYAYRSKQKEYRKWISYKYGLIDYKSLSKEEKENIDSYDFAMYLLLPNEPLMKIKKEYNILFSEILSSETTMFMLAEYFKVPYEVLLFRILELVKQEKEENLESPVYQK